MSDLRNQMILRDKEMVPRFLVQAMFGLMITITAIVAYAQWADVPNSGVVADVAIVRERVVTLTGDRSGVYTVHGGENLLAVSSEPRLGFIGVIGKVVDRRRMLSGVDASAPLRIIERANGHLAIMDDTTGQSVELIGYGVDNIAAFANLLN